MTGIFRGVWTGSGSWSRGLGSGVSVAAYDTKVVKVPDTRTLIFFITSPAVPGVGTLRSFGLSSLALLLFVEFTNRSK